jgi:hypothetical protein
MNRADKSDERGVTAEPLDLPLLRQWLRTLASSSTNPVQGGRRRLFGKSVQTGHSHQNEVSAVAENLTGFLGQSCTEDILRRLLALGVVQYVKRVGRVPVEAKPEDVIRDVTAFALWSVAQAPALPVDWEGVLPTLTSPRMADIVARARLADATRNPDNFGVLCRMLGSDSRSQGTRNLLEDLSDPRRGGAVLASLALSAGLPAPDPSRRQKAAAVWLFTALAGGVLGAEGEHLADTIDQMAGDAWDWLIGDSRGHGSSGSGGGTLAEEIIHDFFHHL